MRRVFACVAVLMVLSGGAQADDNRTREKKSTVSGEPSKFKLDLSGAPLLSNSPAPPPGTATLRRDGDSALPFLGLKFSTQLGK